jgi:hypothetical protein
MSENPQLAFAFDYVQGTDKNVFLTGKAGTGKTTFLRTLIKQCAKRHIVVAPTGVAALNAKGVTIHSFFQMPFGPIIPSANGMDQQDDQGQIITRRFNRTKINIIKGLDLLIIDEISMVRADLLDGIDSVLRRYKDRHRPFGGVQLLMIGDLQQLPPVIKDEDWAILGQYYHTGFFFGSLALQQTPMVCIELKHIYRQSDPRFITLLNKVRENRLDEDAIRELDLRHRPNFMPDDSEGYITLTTHNAQAQQLNQVKLDVLKPRPRTFQALVQGDFPEYLYPTEEALILKQGAQVMFVRNDVSPEKQYYNGKIGTLVGFDEETIEVRCPDKSRTIVVERAIWENTKYTLNDETKDIQADVAGTFTQYPLKLAWAITIHKSQGLTFEKAVVDARSAFTHGQVYVALSRCTSLEGLILSTPIGQRAVRTNTEIRTFTSDIDHHQPTSEQLAQDRHAYQQRLLLDLFDCSAFHGLLARLIKRVREYAISLPENPVDWFLDLGRETREHITAVAEKFQVQIRNMTSDDTVVLETNEILQERVSKGSAYFLEKITGLLLEPLEALVVETDNQAVRSAINEAVKALLVEARCQCACLKACANAFSSTVYLEARAKAALDESGTRKRRLSKAPEPVVEVVHPELYKRLKQWRDKKADLQNEAPNSILTLKIMITIADTLPTSRVQLKRVRGIGKKTMQKIGDELLALISEYTKASEDPAS